MHTRQAAGGVRGRRASAKYSQCSMFSFRLQAHTRRLLARVPVASHPLGGEGVDQCRQRNGDPT
eukprot:5585320-Prymnesium_polylepis.1